MARTGSHWSQSEAESGKEPSLLSVLWYVLERAEVIATRKHVTGRVKHVQQRALRSTLLMVFCSAHYTCLTVPLRKRVPNIGPINRQRRSSRCTHRVYVPKYKLLLRYTGAEEAGARAPAPPRTVYVYVKLVDFRRETFIVIRNNNCAATA